MNLKSLWRNRVVLWDMILKNLKGRYAGSWLGVWWLILTPLLIILSISFVFTYVFNIQIDYFPLFVSINILPWMFLAMSIGESFSSIVNNRDVMQQFNIPKAIIPLSIVGTNFINLLFGLFILIPVVVFFRGWIGVELFLLLAVLMLFLLFVTGISLLMSALYVFVRDIAHFLNSLLMIWFWLTPIFYSVDMIPEKFRILCYLNPLTIYMQGFRNLLYTGEGLSVPLLFGIIVTSAIIFCLGLVVFARLEKHMFKRL